MSIINSVIKGKDPQIEALNVTPSTSAQQITATGNTDGYSPVNVSAVTSSIDANIVAGNIKDGVTILGVTGDYSGNTPTGTKQITSNGTHDVAGYEYADVQVPTTAPAYYTDKTKSNTILQNGTIVVNVNGVNTIGVSVLESEYFYSTLTNTDVDFSTILTVESSGCCKTFSNSNITSLDLSGLAFVHIEGCGQMCQSCLNLTSIDLSGLITLTGLARSAFYAFAAESSVVTVKLNNLTTVDAERSMQNAFSGCSRLQNLYLSNLTTISGSYSFSCGFYNCSHLTQDYIDLSKLTSVSGSYSAELLFSGCTKFTGVLDLSSLVSVIGSRTFQQAFEKTGISSVKLTSLSTLANGCFMNIFRNCTHLTEVVISALRTKTSTLFTSMLYGVTGCTVHFPANLSSLNFSCGGTNTTVLYDLPSTFLLTGANTVEYERNPKYDTATALAWRVKDTGTAPNITIDWTPFYTSGTTDPTVGATIYSDAACTTAVTTISSIA